MSAGLSACARASPEDTGLECSMTSLLAKMTAALVTLGISSVLMATVALFDRQLCQSATLHL